MKQRFKFQLADKKDDVALRMRMAQDAMPGKISISFRREPSYFLGTSVQGDDPQIVKCVDTETEQIIGLGCRVVNNIYVNGKSMRVGYLSDLRAHPAYRGGTLLARGYRFLRKLHQECPVPFYTTMILETNTDAQKILTSGRCGMPVYQDCGRVLSPAIFLDKSLPPIEKEGVSCRKAGASDLAVIFGFLDRELRNKQFAPVYTESDMSNGRLRGLNVSDFYIAERDGRIIGVIAAWDQRNFRQTYIEHYSPLLSLLRPLYNGLAKVSSLKPLPRPGSVIPYFYVGLIAIEGNDQYVFGTLLRYMYEDRRYGPWRYFIVGLHEHDPLAKVLVLYRSIKASGRLYRVYYKNEKDKLPELDGRIPYIEVARL